jgi:hypothetical protein
VIKLINRGKKATKVAQSDKSGQKWLKWLNDKKPQKWLKSEKATKVAQI